MRLPALILSFNMYPLLNIFYIYSHFKHMVSEVKHALEKSNLLDIVRQVQPYMV